MLGAYTTVPVDLRVFVMDHSCMRVAEVAALVDHHATIRKDVAVKATSESALASGSKFRSMDARTADGRINCN